MKQFLIIFILSIYSKIAYLLAVKLQYLFEDLKFFVQGSDYTIGFGTCSGKIVPAAP